MTATDYAVRRIAAAPFAFDFDARYRAAGHGAIAWRAYEYQSEPDEDTEWSGYEVPTGRIMAHMVGDDHGWAFDPDDLEPISESDYCPECGQIGCRAYG